MRILIVGAGLIGTSLARSLSEEGHEVYLIDNQPELVRRANEKLDVKVVLGSGTDPALLKDLNAGSMDIVIAVAHSDETNLLVCSLCASLGRQRRLARLRSRRLFDHIKQCGYDPFYLDAIINPDALSADLIVKTVLSPGAREVADYAGGKILLRTFEVGEMSSLNNTTLAELRDENFPWPFLIVAVVREGRVLIPSGATRLQAGDKIYVMLPASSLAEFLQFVDPHARKPQKAVIYGASDIGRQVAAQLSQVLRDVILLEENPAVAEAAAERLDHVKVIVGAASDKSILSECGIEAADAFIATSENDHINLVAAVLARQLGAKTTTILTQSPDYTMIKDALDIDAIINPKILAVDQILALVRGPEIRSVTKLIDCNAEVLECVVDEDAPITKKPLKEVKFPEDAIVGAVIRGGEVILAKGDTHIQPNDKVIIFSKPEAVKKVQRFVMGPNGKNDRE